MKCRLKSMNLMIGESIDIVYVDIHGELGTPAYVVIKQRLACGCVRENILEGQLERTA